MSWIATILVLAAWVNWYSSSAQVHDRLDFLLIDDIRNDWMFKSNGRCLCHYDFDTPQTTILMGMTCSLRNNISTNFFEQFIPIHSSYDHLNFDAQVMYFKLKVQIFLESQWLQEYEEFLDLVMQRVHGDRLGFSIRIQIEDMIDHWKPYSDKLIKINNGSLFELDYNIGWDIDYKPSTSKVLLIETDFEDIKRLATVVSETYPDEYGQEVERRFKSLHRRFSLQLQHASLSYVEFPKKLDLFSDEVLSQKKLNEENLILKRLKRNPCLLLGSSCAAVLKRVTYPEGQFPGHFLQADVGSSGDTQVIEERLPRVLCSIFTHKVNHATKVIATRDTWARKCTAFIAFSTEDDVSIPSINLPHLAEEQYENMWQKTRSIMKYVHTHYQQDFDWFLFGGDDMHIIMENLYEYLQSPEIVQTKSVGNGVYLGRPLTASIDTISNEPFTYNSGGAGYILDQIALHVLANNLNYPLCHPFQISNFEDALVGYCLSMSGIPTFQSTADNFGRERFHLFYLGFEYEYLSFPADIRSVHWYNTYVKNIKSDDDCCSDQSISAHYLTPGWIYAMDDFIYHCPKSEKDEYYNDKPPGFFDRRGYDVRIPVRQ